MRGGGAARVMLSTRVEPAFSSSFSSASGGAASLHARISTDADKNKRADHITHGLAVSAFFHSL